jgi:long-chain fatty acid transport protein
LSTALKSLLLAGVAGAGVVAIAGQASAAAFYLQEQSTRGSGRAYSGEVADTGVRSLWWNPAAIGTMTGRGEAYLGATAVLVDSSVDNRGSTISRPTLPTLPVGGQDQDDPVNNGLLPSGGVAYKLNDQFAVGIMASSPYSFSTGFTDDSFTRYDALKTRLTTIDLQPTIAWSPSPMLSIGAGANVEYSSATLTTALPNLSPLLADGLERLSGDGWDIGWSVGAQVRPDPRVTLGVSYKSKVDHDLDGKVSISGLLPPLNGSNLTAKAGASFSTPWMFTVGGRFAVTDKLTLNAQVQRVGWSEFDQLSIALGAGSVIGEDYHDTTSYAVGFDYALDPRLTLRAGVQRDPTPTPSSRDARVPDSDRWLFSAGSTFMATDKLGFDLAVSYIDFDGSNVNRTDVAYGGTPAAVTINTKADVDARGLVVGLGAHYSF